MALRYSADTEIRVQWDPTHKQFAGRVRDPWIAWRGHVPGKRPLSPEDYDRAAVALFRAAERVAKRHGASFHVDRAPGGKIRIRRIFQAPCPCSMPRKSKVSRKA